MTDVIDAGERLLDLQMVDADDNPVAKVDDLELTLPDDGGAPYVSAVLSGPLAFGARLGGRMGVWWAGIGARLHPDPAPQPVRIDFGLVTVEATDLRVAVPDPDFLDAQRLEVWLRDHLVRRIPGAGR